MPGFVRLTRKFPTPAVPPSPEDALALLRQDIVYEIEEIVVKALKEPLKQ